MSVELHPSWLAHLQGEFDADYMKSLKAFLKQEKQQGKTIYPKGAEFFNALNTTPLDKVKVVILGQDPYHGPGQAHGLSFSVPRGIGIPPSLVNIYKEIASDLGQGNVPDHGDLSCWAEQGVLLLNAVLSVQQGQAASHQGRGWEQFTDAVVKLVSEQNEGCVFLLWGAYAQKKGQVIDQNRHLVLKAPHPSPLSAHRGFLGCKHFSQCNQYLLQNNQSEINWLCGC